MERRQFPRVKARFRSSFTAGTMLGGDGTIVDLTARGCRIAAAVDVPKQTQLEMRIHVSDDEPPIEIAVAEVIWSDGHEFGVEFKRLQPKTFDRISRLIKSLKVAQTA